MFPTLIHGGEGKPQVEENDTNVPELVFANLSWSAWPEARVEQSLKYVRSNRHLQVPRAWQMVFPKPFEILHKMEIRASEGKR